MLFQLSYSTPASHDLYTEVVKDITCMGDAVVKTYANNTNPEIEKKRAIVQADVESLKTGKNM